MLRTCVALAVLSLLGCGRLATTPVTAAASTNYVRLLCYFCSTRCQQKYAGDPPRYLKEASLAAAAKKRGEYTCLMHSEVRQIGPGNDVAMESAGITLVHGDLRSLVRALRLSRATMANIRQNLFLAFVYNVASVPVAAGLLYPVLGLLISPVWASVAMSFSSLSVVGNALRLRKVKL